MVVFSILLVEEMFAFKYATVRLFGGKKTLLSFSSTHYRYLQRASEPLRHTNVRL